MSCSLELDGSSPNADLLPRGGDLDVGGGLENDSVFGKLQIRTSCVLKPDLLMCVIERQAHSSRCQQREHPDSSRVDTAGDRRTCGSIKAAENETRRRILKRKQDKNGVVDCRQGHQAFARPCRRGDDLYPSRFQVAYRRKPD